METYVHANLSKSCSEIFAAVFVADFKANFLKFQILLEQPIFVVQKHLLYKKASIFDGKFDEIKLKWFA